MTSSKPSTGSSDSQPTRATVPAVLLVPAPAITCMRAPRLLAGALGELAQLASVKVGDSPVVPPTTMPLVPLCA